MAWRAARAARIAHPAHTSALPTWQRVDSLPLAPLTVYGADRTKSFHFVSARDFVAAAEGNWSRVGDARTFVTSSVHQ